MGSVNSLRLSWHNERGEMFHVQSLVSGESGVAQHSAGSLGEHLPGH